MVDRPGFKALDGIGTAFPMPKSAIVCTRIKRPRVQIDLAFLPKLDCEKENCLEPTLAPQEFR